MRIIRRPAKVIRIGRLYIGGKHPVAIQSMTKVKAASCQATVRQLEGLKDSGCEIARIAIKDKQDAEALREIKKSVDMAIVADIHFDWRLALLAIDNGADKIRLNPGNIYRRGQIKEVAYAAKSAGIPIRIGVNSGSLPGRAFSVNKMVRSALDYIKILEGYKFYNIVISLKASGILDTIEAYRKIAKLCDYPLHLGVTATGLPYQGTIKSSIALGALLSEGIGDTIRVSLSCEPKEEVKAAKAILESLRLRRFGPEIISCPTCGRCEVDLVKLVKEFESRLSAIRYPSKPITVAIMGCVVNGPGEAAQADIGIAFGKKQGLLFRKGRPLRKVNFNQCVDVLLTQISKSQTQ